MSRLMDKPQIIETSAALSALVGYLQQFPCLACDTESNGLFAYYERVCLIQISVDTGQATEDYIIDPLAIENLQELGVLFANPAIEIIFHAAEYDIISMKRDFGFEFNQLFDTYLAARVLGMDKVGLGALLDRYFGITVNKHYQQADWSQRPLPEDQLAYAQMDTHYLPALRNLLVDELNNLNYLQEAYEIFAEIAQAPAASREFDPDGFWRIRTPRLLQPTEAAILRELYIWREQQAAQQNVPPYRVMRDNELVAIAMMQPRHVDHLAKIKGASQQNLRRYGKAIVHLVKHGQQSPPPPPPPHQSQPDENILVRYQALYEWRKRRAAKRGVEGDIILSKTALWALAHHVPTTLHELEQIQEIGPYRRQQYAVELLEILRSV